MIPRLIETARLELHPLRESDAEEMVSVLAHDSLYEFTGGEAPSHEILRERYRHQLAGPNSPGELWCNWIIRTIVDNCAMGFIQATILEGSADVAWLVGVESQRQGFAAEAALALRYWLAGEDLRRIEAHIHPSHSASQAVARRTGLLPTGTFDDDGEEIWAMSLAGVGLRRTVAPRGSVQ